MQAGDTNKQRKEGSAMNNYKYIAPNHVKEIKKMRKEFQQAKKEMPLKELLAYIDEQQAKILDAIHKYNLLEETARKAKMKEIVEECKEYDRVLRKLYGEFNKDWFRIKRILEAEQRG